jgi:hypothetical protein
MASFNSSRRLMRAIDALRAGDVLVVTWLDRLARSTRCRWLRREKTFLPSIGEVLKALREAKVPGAPDEFGDGPFEEDDDGELVIVTVLQVGDRGRESEQEAIRLSRSL